MSRLEEYIQALVDGTEADSEPKSRIEEYLLGIINKVDVEELPEPKSRVEALLYKLAETGVGGGGSEEPGEGEEVTDMLQIFVNEKKSTASLFNQWPGDNVDFAKDLDTGNVTSMNSMYSNSLNLVRVPQFNTSKVTSMTGMFSLCKSLQVVPEMDTSNVKQMSTMFNGCSKLTYIPHIDVSNVTSMYNTFSSCKSLVSVPPLNTTKAEDMKAMFKDCTALENVPLLNLNMASSYQDMFLNCASLKNLTVSDIKKNLQVGSGTSWGHLLTVESLIGLCKECVRYYNNQLTLTVGSANLEKLANVYVKFTDPNVTSIPANTKGDVEVCDSTDERAMTITEYMMLKYWNLQ